MNLENIKSQINDTLVRVYEELKHFQNMEKPPKINEGKYLQLILSKLRLILGNPILNPIMKYEEAISYYFNDENALENIQIKYITILELQDYIVQETTLPFIYDKYTILKMLNITLNTYNEILSEAKSGSSPRNEDVNNIFLDIETMLLNDRNTSAENGTKNYKAIDNVNKYKANNGGYGVVVEKEKFEQKQESKIISVEVVDQKLEKFGFSKKLGYSDNAFEES